jgi:hypothetical protein
MKLALALCLLAVPATAQETTDAPGALLRGLDKVSGISTDIEVQTGGTTKLGRLEIALSNCRYPTNDPSSNAFAHLTIRDPLASGLSFDGWMIASSPALNALDHPRYDVWLLRCTNVAASGGSD